MRAHPRWSASAPSGAAYASRFLEAGADLRVVVDPERAARYRAEPTVVNGRAYRFPLLDDDVPADLVIVAVKHPQLDEAIELLRPGVGRDTVVLSLLNGIDSEDVLAGGAPGGPVPYAISVGIDAVRDGRDVRYTSLGRIVFGEATNPGPPAAAVAGSPACSPRRASRTSCRPTCCTSCGGSS